MLTSSKVPSKAGNTDKADKATKSGEVTVILPDHVAKQNPTPEDLGRELFYTAGYLVVKFRKIRHVAPSNSSNGKAPPKHLVEKAVAFNEFTDFIYGTIEYHRVGGKIQVTFRDTGNCHKLTKLAEARLECKYFLPVE